MKIEKLAEDIFKVTVSRGVTTQHEVTVTNIGHYDLTKERKTKEELLDFSFRFLLDREPNTSILSKFEITIISQYFPEYETEVHQILTYKKKRTNNET